MSLPPHQPEKMSPAVVNSGPLGVAGFIIDTFSTVRKSEPPLAGKTSHIRLITINASHFCEKARWVLDILHSDPESPYYFDEDSHPAGFHGKFALEASNNEASMTPMVVYANEAGDGEEKVMWGSSEIVQEFMPSLYPKEIEQEIKAMEAELARRFGSPIRCFVYYHLLEDLKTYGSVMVDLNAKPGHVATVERILLDKMLDKGVDKAYRVSMEINAEHSEASEKSVRDVFRELSDRLETSGGKYLMDTPEKSYGFTAVDLTFSALAATLLRVTEMENWLMKDEARIPECISQLGKEMRQTKAGQHVLDMYKKHRPVNTEGKVVIKTAKRDKYPWEGMSYYVGVAGVIALATVLARRR